MAQDDIQVLDVWLKCNNRQNIFIDENDLRIDTYRSSGAGGQHVNTICNANL